MKQIEKYTESDIWLNYFFFSICLKNLNLFYFSFQFQQKITNIKNSHSKNPLSHYLFIFINKTKKKQIFMNHFQIFLICSKWTHVCRRMTAVFNVMMSNAWRHKKSLPSLFLFLIVFKIRITWEFNENFPWLMLKNLTLG